MSDARHRRCTCMRCRAGQALARAFMGLVKPTAKLQRRLLRHAERRLGERVVLESGHAPWHMLTRCCCCMHTAQEPQEGGGQEAEGQAGQGEGGPPCVSASDITAGCVDGVQTLLPNLVGGVTVKGQNPLNSIAATWQY